MFIIALVLCSILISQMFYAGILRLLVNIDNKNSGKLSAVEGTTVRIYSIVLNFKVMFEPILFPTLASVWSFADHVHKEQPRIATPRPQQQVAS